MTSIQPLIDETSAVRAIFADFDRPITQEDWDRLGRLAKDWLAAIDDYNCRCAIANRCWSDHLDQEAADLAPSLRID